MALRSREAGSGEAGPRMGGAAERSGDGVEREADSTGDKLRGVEGVTAPPVGGAASGPGWLVGEGGACSAAECSGGAGEARRSAEQPREGASRSAGGAGLLSTSALILQAPHHETEAHDPQGGGAHQCVGAHPGPDYFPASRAKASAA
jgi:hypothetical protein